MKPPPGHKTQSIFDRYHIIGEGDLREAAQRLAKAMGTPQAPLEQSATAAVTGIKESSISFRWSNP